MVIVYNPCVEGNWYHGYCIQPVCGKEGVGITVIVYNPCVEGVGITVTVYNPCLERRELVSRLLYTTRVWKGGSWYHSYCIQPVCGREGVGIMVIVYNPCVKGREFGIMVIV